MVATSLAQPGGSSGNLAPPRNGPCPTNMPAATDDCSPTGGYTSCFYLNIICKCNISGPWVCDIAPIGLMENNETDVEDLDIVGGDESFDQDGFDGEIDGLDASRAAATGSSLALLFALVSMGASVFGL